jgi:hypothetical protein
VVTVLTKDKFDPRHHQQAETLAKDGDVICITSESSTQQLEYLTTHRLHGHQH